MSNLVFPFGREVLDAGRDEEERAWNSAWRFFNLSRGRAFRVMPNLKISFALL